MVIVAHFAMDAVKELYIDDFEETFGRLDLNFVTIETIKWGASTQQLDLLHIQMVLRNSITSI